jgi:5-methyltetrahydropteroyltriglutamate--homocysteine methyltransferase
MVLTASFGSYPRPDSLREYQLSKYGKQKKKGEYDADDERAFDSALQQYVAAQEGIDIITDGQFKWDDYMAHVMSTFSGVEMSGLIRFYDNNNYYRRPVIRGEIIREEGILSNNVPKLRELSPSKIKVVIPGPYTLSKLAEDKFYGSQLKVMEAIFEVLKTEVKAANDVGADYIQIDEPSLSYHYEKENADAAIELINALAAEIDGKSIIATYFGDSSGIMDDISKLKSDYIGIDCVSYPANYRALLASGLRNLQLGLIDARNVKMESRESVLERAEPFGDDVIISTNYGLEFVGGSYAAKKLRLLSEIK